LDHTAQKPRLPLELQLARLVHEAGTGALEVLHGKRRRRFYLRAGELVGSTSNLKREQAAQVTATLPGAAPELINEHLAAARLAGCLTAPSCEIIWREAAEPRRQFPSRIWVVLFEALELAFEESALRERLVDAQMEQPRCVAQEEDHLAGLGLPVEYREWLARLDGFRPLEELVRFGPGEPRSLASALYLAWMFGALAPPQAGPSQPVELDEAQAPAPVDPVDPVEAEPVSAPVDLDQRDDEPEEREVPKDLSSLIAASVTPHASAGSEPASEDLGHEPLPEEDAPATQAPPEENPAPEVDDDGDGDDLVLEEEELVDGHEVSFSRTGGFGVSAPAAEPAQEDPERRADSSSWTMGTAEANLRAEIHRIMQAEDVFQVLAQPWESEVAEFRNAYFRLARTLHPDRLPVDDPELKERAEEAFDKARHAWELLKDDEQRQQTIDRVVHGKLTEEEEAMEEVQALLAIEKLFDRALALFHSGRIVQAADMFRQVVVQASSHPDFDVPEFHIYYGYCMWRMAHGRDEEKADEGVEMMQAALNKNQRHKEGLLLLGRVLRERGHPEEARRFFIKVLKLDPEHKDALRQLARLKREKEGRGRGRGKSSGKDSPRPGFFSRLFSRGKKGGDKDAEKDTEG